MVDGESVERNTAFVGSVLQIRLRSLVFLLWNMWKASLGFGGASNSEFAEFLLQFLKEETFQPTGTGKLENLQAHVNFNF